MSEPRPPAAPVTDPAPDSQVSTEAPAPAPPPASDSFSVTEAPAPAQAPPPAPDSSSVTDAPAPDSFSVTAPSFSVPVPGVPGEMLLQEPIGEVTPAPVPSYIDNFAIFDQKMYSLGMKRSDTQPYTRANGNCGPEGIYLESLNILTRN